MIDQIQKRLKRYRLPIIGEKQARPQAAVLLPIINSNDPGLILTERSANLASHAGEVAWPGGKQDVTDVNLQHTALRETEEEIGIAAEQIEIVAQLRPFISKFGLLVTPFVGIVEASVELRPNAAEIASVFELPLSYLLNDPRVETSVIERHGERHVVPVYDYAGYRVWGLTAMILYDFMCHGLAVKVIDQA
ncbi:MAG: CoA pyrophosphatase [Pseudomonadales bacterium]|nr:CoA pyrophosphatase [Pseudomonadales bacterium]